MEARKVWDEQRQVQLININNKNLSIKELNGQRVITFKDIDMLHERVEGTAGRNFRENKKHFVEKEDYYFIKPSDIQNDEIRRSEINNAGTYFITESGYLMLVKSLTDDLAWKVQRELVNKYFRSENGVKELSPQLQLLINMELQQKKIVEQLNQVNHHALEAKAKAEETKEQIQDIRDVITLDPNSWREDCRKLISKIASKLGGYQYIKDINKEIYSLMDIRLSSRLSIRLTNKRRRMADEGVCKSKRDKLTYVDVIADDKKLIEGYKAIVKEMAIKYGVA